MQFWPVKKLRIEIPVTILSICIAVAVIIAGYFAYQSMSGIVETIHKEARPDLKLLLIKDISSDLNEVENTIRLYSLSGDVSLLKSFKQLNNEIGEKLEQLQSYADVGSQEKQMLDSIGVLATRKLLIWEEIRKLHQTRETPKQTFTKLYSKIDTVIVETDTIKVKPEEKKSFFKRLFAKKDTTKRSIIVDNTKEKEAIKAEIEDIEQTISSQTQKLQTKDKILLEKNIAVTETLYKLIAKIEIAEQKHLEEKTAEADAMAGKTYQRMAVFIIAAVILLIIVLILFFRNLQQNRAYQQVLRKAKSEAESLAKAKETFVATVSHEMRTPVNAIFGLTEQLLRKGQPEETRTDLTIVQKSAEHLLALVNDTLDFSKIESQKMKLDQVDFRLRDLVREIEVMVSEQAKKKNIELQLTNNTEPDLTLNGDPIRLKQIIINLATNAIKFTAQGKVEVSFVDEYTPDGHIMLKIKVTDTGVGIPADKLPYIFDEFVQVGTDLTQKQRGAGLGLAIVKKLVSLHSGKIDVQSIFGKGTQFALEIPYKKGIIQTTSEPAELVIPEWFSSLKFLVVDDEEFNLHLMRNILKKWGITTVEAGNGLEAVEQSTKENFDLILIDIRMPVMDGYEASRKILQGQTNAKIVALTATTRPEDVEKIKAAGIHDYLPKPFLEQSLFDVVLKLVPEKQKAESLSISGETDVDFKELERLSGGDAAFMKEMLSIFVRSAEEASEKFGQYFDQENRKQIAETAHKLAAPAKHIMATKLYEMLKVLEKEAEPASHEFVKKIIQETKLEIEKVVLLIKEKLD